MPCLVYVLRFIPRFDMSFCCGGFIEVRRMVHESVHLSLNNTSRSQQYCDLYIFMYILVIQFKPYQILSVPRYYLKHTCNMAPGEGGVENPRPRSSVPHPVFYFLTKTGAEKAPNCYHSIHQIWTDACVLRVSTTVQVELLMGVTFTNFDLIQKS